MKAKELMVGLIVFLLMIVVFQWIVIGKMNIIAREQDEMIDYWFHKNDSLLNNYMNLSEQYWDLKDSLITIKYEEKLK